MRVSRRAVDDCSPEAALPRGAGPRHFPVRGLVRLGLVPQRVHLGERRLLRRLAVRGERPFDRAETALEDLADLFRVLMADNRDLVPLEREVELCRQYLGLEALRLGNRLRVQWQVDKMPGDALVPPLLLQPLLENAVYHGIEPSMEPGVISIHIFNDRDRVHMLLRNPSRKEGSHHTGNKMALANIRERLSLHFDAEASLQTRDTGGQYEVRIALPYVREGR